MTHFIFFKLSFSTFASFCADDDAILYLSFYICLILYVYILRLDEFFYHTHIQIFEVRILFLKHILL